MSEHPHQGRITAVAYLSTGYAAVDMCSQSLEERVIVVDDGVVTLLGTSARTLCLLADEIMEPLGVANVLQTIEEVLEADGVPAGLAFKSGNENGRAEIVRWLIDGRQAADQDEREAEHA